MQEISKDDVCYTIDRGEFPDEIKCKEKAAVIMTQKNNPKWKEMFSWLKEVKDVEIYVMFYDNIGFLDDFKKFKKKIFGNNQLPYVRYYKKCDFSSDSNFVPKEEFERRFD